MMTAFERWKFASSRKFTCSLLLPGSSGISAVLLFIYAKKGTWSVSGASSSHFGCLLPGLKELTYRTGYVCFYLLVNILCLNEFPSKDGEFYIWRKLLHSTLTLMSLSRIEWCFLMVELRLYHRNKAFSFSICQIIPGVNYW